MPTNNRFTDPVVDDAVSFSDPIVEDNPSSFTDPVVEPDKVDLRTRLRQKDSLLNKIGYVKNRTKKDEPDAEGNTLDDYRRYVNSTDFNKLDDERLGLLANAIDTRHAEVSKKDLSGVSGVARNFGRSLAKGYSRFGTYKAMGNSPSAKLARSMGGAPSEVDDEYARALYEQNKELEETMPTARGGVQDVRSVSDAANYALGGIAENLTSTVDQIGKSVAGGIVAGPVGARAAAAVSGFDQNRGEAISDQIEEGVDKIDFGLANVQALGYSAVDAAFSGAGYVGRKIAGKVAGQTLKDAKKSFIKSISGAALSATKAGLEEAVNEPMQSQVVGRLRRKAQTGSALRDGETVEDAVMEGVNESVGGFISGFAFGGAESAVELKRNKNVMRKADTVIGRLSVDTDISQIQGFDKKLVADYMLGMAVMPDADEKTQADIRSRQSEIMDTVDGNTKTILTAYQSIFTDASFDNVPDTVKPTFDAKKAYASKVEESDGTETYFDETSGIMIQGREGTWSVFNRNGMKMPIAEDGNVKTIQDAVGFAQNLSRLNQWRIENNQSKSSFIQKLAEKNHPGAKVVMIDTPEQAPEGARARMIGGEQGFYNPGDNTVYVMLDAVQNPAQAAIILAHEDTHRGLMEAMKKGGLIGENETVDEAKKRLFGAATSEQAETQEERVARGGEDFTGNLGTLAKLRDTAQVWLSDKTGIKTVLGDADIRLLLDTIGKLGKSSEDGSVEYRPEGQSDANKIRFEDAKNGRLTLEEEAQRQNDLAPDEKVSQERVINRDTKRAGLVAGMNQETPAPSVIEKTSDVPSVQADTDTSVMARPESSVRTFVKGELRVDRIKEKHGDLFQQAMDVTDGDEQAATGLVSEWLAGQSIADKSIPDSVRVASKLEQKADLSAKDVDTLEQNAIFGKDLFMFGYRKDKQTGEWKFQQPVQEPAQDASQPLPVEPFTSAPVSTTKPVAPKPSAGDKMTGESFGSFFKAANTGGEYDLLQRWHEGRGLFGKPSKDAGGEYDAYRALPANLKKMIRGKSKMEITAAAKELAEEFGPEYAEPITGPELMVSEWVRQYNVYKAWKENGAVPDVQVDEYAKRAKYEHEQQKNDLAVFKQKVENGEVIEEGTPVFVNLDSKALESNGVDAEFPVMRVMSSHVTSGKLVYRLMSANGNIVDLYADKVDKRDVSNEVEYDESERDYLGREDAAPGLVAGEVQDDSGKDYDADEQASIEWANGLDEERIKADRQRAGSGQAVGRNDGSLFDEKALPFNLDGGEVEDVVRIAAEKKAEEDRQEAVKRKLDEAPMLPGVDTAVVKESFTPEKATPNVASATSNVALKRGTKVATTRNADGVSYFGEVLQSNPDGTVKIRAFKEKAKGTIAAKTYGVDKAGNRVTKDVDVPAESVKSVDATADTSKLTDEERRKLKMIEKVDAANADNELKAGNQAAAPDVIDKFNDTKERKEKRRTDNGDVMFRRSMAGTPSTADILDTETGLQAARRIVQDYFKPWERQQSKIEKAIKRRLAEDVDVYSAEDKSYGLVRNGVQQFEKNFIEKAEKVLKDNGLTVEEFDQFLMAMAGPTRNKMIADRTDGKNPTGSGQTDAYWNNIISAYRSRGKFAKLKEAAEHVWALNRAVLDMKVSAGLMSKAQADMWKAMSPFYVPLRSDDAEADYNQLGKRATMSLKGKESKSATGRALGHEADTPFAFSVLQALEAVVRANKNIVHETAAKLIEQNPSGLWSIKDRIPTKQSYDADAGKVVSVPDSQFEDAPNVVIVKRDGKKKYLVFEGADGLKLARSLKKESLKHAYAWVSALTRTYAMMRTALVPTFILRNMRADFLQLTINMTAEQKVKMIPQVFKNMKDSWVAVFTYERDGKAKGALATYANEFFSNGGQIAGFGVQSVDKINQGLNRHVKKHGKLMTNFGMPALKFYEYVERGNASIETGTRLALYAAMRKEGKSIRDSIEAGKNITVNFNRKGELGPLVNSVYMFSNVAVQDAARSLKAITGKNGAAVVVGLLGAAFAASMLNNRGDDDDEDKTGAGRYKNIPESEKKRNIIIKIGGKYVKQPIRGIWAWIYYAGTKAGDVAFGKYESYKAALDVAASALDTINILGTSGSVAQFVTPTILDPVVQHIENKSYTGDPMRQQKFTDAQPDSTTGMKRTPGWMKATAKGLNKATGGDEATKGWIDVAPETIKHVIDTLAGGIGTDVSYGVGFASDAVKGDYDVDKTPVVRDVVRDLPDTTRRYYEAKDKFDAGVYAVNHYKTAKERSAYYLENPFMKPSLADRIKTLHKTIKELREKESKTDVKERKATLEARRLRLQSTVLRLMDTDAKK